MDGGKCKYDIEYESLTSCILEISSWANIVWNGSDLYHHYKFCCEELNRAEEERNLPPEHCFCVYKAFDDESNTCGYMLLLEPTASSRDSKRQREVRILVMSVHPQYLEDRSEDPDTLSPDPLKDKFVEFAAKVAEKRQATSLVAIGEDEVQQQYYAQCDWAWKHTERCLWTYQKLSFPNPAKQTRIDPPRPATLELFRPIDPRGVFKLRESIFDEQDLHASKFGAGPALKATATLQTDEIKTSNGIEFKKIRVEVDKLKEEIKLLRQIDTRLEEALTENVKLLQSEIANSRRMESNLKRQIEKLTSDVHVLRTSQLYLGAVPAQQTTHPTDSATTSCPVGLETPQVAMDKAKDSHFRQLETPLQNAHSEHIELKAEMRFKNLSPNERGTSAGGKTTAGHARKINDVVSLQSGFSCHKVNPSSAEWSALELVLQDWKDQLDTRQHPLLSEIPDLFGKFAKSLAIARKAGEQTSSARRTHYIYVVADAKGVCAGLLHLVIRLPGAINGLQVRRQRVEYAAEIWGICMHPLLLQMPAEPDRLARNALLDEARKAAKANRLIEMTASNADATAMRYFRLRPWVWRQLDPVARPHDWTEQFCSDSDDVLTSSGEPFTTWSSLCEVVQQWKSGMDKYLYMLGRPSDSCAAAAGKYRHCIKNLTNCVQNLSQTAVSAAAAAAAGKKPFRLRVCATRTKSGECMGVLLLVRDVDLPSDSRSKTTISGLCTHPRFWQSPDLSAAGGSDYAVRDSLIGQAEHTAETQGDFVLAATYVTDSSDAAYFASRDWQKHSADTWSLQLASPIGTGPRANDSEMDDKLKGYVFVDESDLLRGVPKY